MTLKPSKRWANAGPAAESRKATTTTAARSIASSSRHPGRCEAAIRNAAAGLLRLLDRYKQCAHRPVDVGARIEPLQTRLHHGLQLGGLPAHGDEAEDGAAAGDTMGNTRDSIERGLCRR